MSCIIIVVALQLPKGPNLGGIGEAIAENAGGPDVKKAVGQVCHVRLYTPCPIPYSLMHILAGPLLRLAKHCWAHDVNELCLGTMAMCVRGSTCE